MIKLYQTKGDQPKVLLANILRSMQVKSSQPVPNTVPVTSTLQFRHLTGSLFHRCTLKCMHCSLAVHATLNVSEVVQDWAQWLTTASDILHGVHASCTCPPETGVQTQPTGSQY